MEEQMRAAELPSDYVQEKCVEYKPSKQEALGRYEINIQFLSRGCVIRVGCKSIPFSSTEEAISELKKYFDKPWETQEEWNKKLQ
jgi:hypothetical protein